MKQVEILQMYREEGLELGAKVIKYYTLGKLSDEIAKELDISIDEVNDIIREYEEVQFNN